MEPIRLLTNFGPFSNAQPIPRNCCILFLGVFFGPIYHSAPFIVPQCDILAFHVHFERYEILVYIVC